MERYIDPADCEIIHNYPGSKGTVLMDCAGEVFEHFGKDWTDDQIWYALGFANRLYSIGLSIGKADKAREIRRALGLT